MASLQVLKLSPSTLLDFRGKSDRRRRILRWGRCGGGSYYGRCLEMKKLRVYCAVEDGDFQSNGEEPPESLFMKELKRRGITPSSLLEGNKRSSYGTIDEIKTLEEDGRFSKRNAISTEVDKSLSNQRERSMALNSEGLEGFVPRAKLLLSLGGTFSLGFWPLILITMAFFSALYLF